MSAATVQKHASREAALINQWTMLAETATAPPIDCFLGIVLVDLHIPRSGLGIS